MLEYISKEEKVCHTRAANYPTKSMSISAFEECLDLLSGMKTFVENMRADIIERNKRAIEYSTSEYKPERKKTEKWGEAK